MGQGWGQTAVLTLLLAATAAAQQAKHTVPARTRAPVAATMAGPAGTVPVVMLSDLHFDPFYDPGKFEQLRAEGADWKKILSEPDTEGREAALAKLNAACAMRGNDSSWTLVEAALKAAHASAPHPAFVLNSGDLVAHHFECRFRRLAPKASAEELSNFAAKAVSFVISETEHAFPGTRVFSALGNNDSGCDDYHETPDSSFLRAIEAPMKSSVGLAEDDGPHTDSYSAAMPQEISHGRVIMLNDIFQAATYRGCDGKPNPAAAEAQLAWLRTQLEHAREKHEQVWVVAHIPPGIDVYNTVTRKRDVCGKEDAVVFLSSNKLAELLAEFAPEVRLAVFAHTHMDEMRVLSSGKPGESVAAKLVPSVSPINGNYPAYTIGYVDQKTAELKDYRVFAGDSQTGVNAHWSEEYSFSKAYKRKAFTTAEIAPMLAAMRADHEGALPESNAYENYFMVNGGLRALALRLVWPQYACALENTSAAGFKACMCPAVPAAK